MDQCNLEYHLVSTCYELLKWDGLVSSNRKSICLYGVEDSRKE